jgi:hypothetical protein
MVVLPKHVDIPCFCHGWLFEEVGEVGSGCISSLKQQQVCEKTQLTVCFAWLCLALFWHQIWKLNSEIRILNFAKFSFQPFIIG